MATATHSPRLAALEDQLKHAPVIKVASSYFNFMTDCKAPELLRLIK